MNGPRTSKPNTPNRDGPSNSPTYDPGSRTGSDESDSTEGSKDQDMVDLTEDEATANIGEPNEPFTQEENEEHFIEALMMRNQNEKLGSVQEVIQAILDIGGEAIGVEGVPVSFTARIALKLLQRSDPLSLLVKNYEERQDDMMKDQRKIFRDQMAYLHRKTLERVSSDTKAMV